MALVEALVSVLIFAVGVLGVIGLQTLALKSSTDGKYRADAAYMANQLIGQMWADSRSNLPSYAHYCSNTSAGCAPPTLPLCSTSGSASTNPAVAAWLTQLANEFPAGATASNLVQISVVPVTPVYGISLQTLPTYQVAVSICWHAPRDPSGQYHSYVVAAQIS